MGRLDVDAMLAEMDSDQCSEWMAYRRVRPSEEARAAAQVCAVLANVMGPGERTFLPADFLPARPADFEQSPEDIRAALHSFGGE